MKSNRFPTEARRITRRGAARLLGGGLALFASGNVIAAPETSRKRNKRRIRRSFRAITRTFSNDGAIVLDQGAAAPYPSSIVVTGFNRGRILDIDVTLRQFSHTFPNDLDIQLVAPSGHRAVIMSDTSGNAGGTSAVSGLTLTLDDQAPAFLPAPLRSGRFRPVNFETLDDPFPAPGAPTSNVQLATFQGLNPNGIWRLCIVDDFPLSTSGTGRIEAGWSLTIRARALVIKRIPARKRKRARRSASGE